MQTPSKMSKRIQKAKCRERRDLNPGLICGCQGRYRKATSGRATINLQPCQYIQSCGPSVRPKTLEVCMPTCPELLPWWCPCEPSEVTSQGKIWCIHLNHLRPSSGLLLHLEQEAVYSRLGIGHKRSKVDLCATSARPCCHHPSVLTG